MEVGHVGDHHVTVLSKLERSADQLGEQEGERVGDEYFAWLGSDQRRQLVSEPRGFCHPTSTVPAAHEALGPLVVDHFVNPSTRRLAHRSERVAVEVDLAFAETKLAAQGREFVEVIHYLAVVTQYHSTDLTSHKKG